MSESRPRRSLFGEILDWMLTPLLLLWPISLAVTWWVAQGIADKPFDRALIEQALTLTQYVQVRPNGQVGLRAPVRGNHWLRADEHDQLRFQVLAPDGSWLAGERQLPAPPRQVSGLAHDAGVYLRDTELDGQPLRVAHTWVPLPAATAATAPPGRTPPAVLVQVAETRNKRSQLAAEIIKGVMLPQFLALPLAVALIWLALARGMQPMARLERRIAARASDDLSPLDAQALPLEIGPLVGAINGLLTRLSDSIAAQKRFLADAAHQLKTPLAGLRMQAELAQREGANEGELKQSLAQISRSTVRATHTVNQLLALARAEAGGAALVSQPCDLAEIALDVMADAVPRALERGVDLGYDGPSSGDPAMQLSGRPALLAEMLRNLVDNALHYAPGRTERPGVVTVRLATRAAGVQLDVEDNGPGIPEAERELVLQPFYRVLGTGVDGSGLGLPIVREIAQQHGAHVQISDAQPGQTPPGTRVSVRFASSGGGVGRGEGAAESGAGSGTGAALTPGAHSPRR